jgi:hypothetical protein
MTVADMMKYVETSLRTCAVDPTAAIARNDELWHQLIEVTEKDASKVIPALKIFPGNSQDTAEARVKDTPKVLIVARSFVRRDDFSVDELISHLSRKASSARSPRGRVDLLLRLCSPLRTGEEVQAEAALQPLLFRRVQGHHQLEIESWWKHRVEHKNKEGPGDHGALSHCSSQHEQET